MNQFDWLVAAFPKTVFTVFDTETTGLDPRTNRVVEIGGIRFDTKGISARFNVLMNPDTFMPSEVTRINGITDAMLAGQPKAASVIPDFLRFIGDSVLIAHNAPFDVSFINEELLRLGLSPLRNKILDTRIFAKDIFAGLPNYKLQDLALRFGIEALNAHRAEDDARVCRDLFLVCFDKMKEKNPKLVEAAIEAALQAERLTKSEPSLFSDPAAVAPVTTASDTPYSDDRFADDMESEEEFWDGQSS